mmetsp:Transcript_57520/g.160142  ORF Transcript_57520/g.160142 Transcript_57520/m.160142 type:complete len:104 (+) Transcript_57520:1629-1940(+)
MPSTGAGDDRFARPAMSCHISKRWAFSFLAGVAASVWGEAGMWPWPQGSAGARRVGLRATRVQKSCRDQPGGRPADPKGVRRRDCVRGEGPGLSLQPARVCEM